MPEMSTDAWKGFRHDPPPPYMPTFPRFTVDDVEIEADVLDVLAAETALTDPWTAATNLFGGRNA